MFVHVFFLKEIIGIRFAPCLRAKLSARGGSFSAPVLHGAAPSPGAQPFSSELELESVMPLPMSMQPSC